MTTPFKVEATIQDYQEYIDIWEAESTININAKEKRLILMKLVRQ